MLTLQFTEHNMPDKLQYSKHSLQYIHSQQMKNTIQHKTHARLIALAVVQTQSMTYTAQCAGSKMCDL